MHYFGGGAHTDHVRGPKVQRVPNEKISSYMRSAGGVNTGGGWGDGAKCQII